MPAPEHIHRFNLEVDRPAAAAAARQLGALAPSMSAPGHEVLGGLSSRLSDHEGGIFEISIAELKAVFFAQRARVDNGESAIDSDADRFATQARTALLDQMDC